MNRKIEQLTRNYLDNLYLVEANQKREIIRLNNETNWIIFHSRSLQTKYSRGADQTYDITSEPLQKLFQEQLKIHRSPDWKDIFLSGDDDPNSISPDNIRVKLLNVLRGESLSSWIAVDKTALGNGFGAVTMDIDNVDLTVGTTQIKSKWNLDDLLNDPVITSSTAPSSSNNDNNDRERQTSKRTETPLPNDNSYHHSSQTPPSSPTPQTITSAPFIITRLEQVQPSQVDIYPSSLEIRGQSINLVTIVGKKARIANRNWQAGSKIKITDIQFGGESNTIIDGNELIIFSRNFDRIEVEENPSNSSHRSTSHSTPTIFAETQRKNQEIDAENDNLALLAYELAEIIKKNNELCQKARAEKGLDLARMLKPDGSPLSLTEFEVALEKLNEYLPLNSPVNQRILNRNQEKKQVKESFANTLKQTWKDNQSKYQNTPQKFTPPNPEISLKQKIKEIILQIEACQADMATLAEGKYKNYQTTLENFTTLAEVENYAQVIFESIKQFKQNQPSNGSDSPKLSSPPNSSISEGEKAILNANSLHEAQIKAIEELEKFLVAKGVKEKDQSFTNKIKEIKEIKEIWKFVRHYKRQVEAELEQKQSENKNALSQKPGFPLRYVLMPVFIVGILINLALIIKISRSKRKIKN